MCGAGLPSATDHMVSTRADARLVNRIRWDWVNLAWSTERCDRDQADEAIRTLYRAARLSKPEILWCQSPQEVTATMDALQSFDHPDSDRLLASRLAVTQLGVLRQRIQPMASRHNRCPLLWADPRRLTGDSPVPEEVRWQVFDALSATNVIPRLARLGQRVWRRCRYAVGTEWVKGAGALYLMGILEEAILWDCYLQVGGVEDPVTAAALDVFRLVSCVAWLDGLVIVSERPVVIRRGVDDMLHAERQPAIVWDDGTYLNWWNGVELPAGFWDWTGDQVIACDNLELRSIAIEYMGWEPIAESLTPIAVADDPGNPGQVIELYEFTVASGLESVPGERQRFVRVTNASPCLDGSRRSYIIQVAPWITDPVAAVAESFGVSADVYRDLVRAC